MKRPDGPRWGRAVWCGAVVMAVGGCPLLLPDGGSAEPDPNQASSSSSGGNVSSQGGGSSQDPGSSSLAGSSGVPNSSSAAGSSNGGASTSLDPGSSSSGVASGSSVGGSSGVATSGVGSSGVSSSGGGSSSSSGSGGFTGTWRGAGPEGGTVTALFMLPGPPDTLFAGTQGGGMFRSTNQGATWTASGTLGPHYVSAFAAIPGATPGVLAATSDGLFRSNDRGLTWTEVPTGLVGAFRALVAVAVDPLNPATWYVASNVMTIGTGTTFLKTQDSGTTWQTLTVTTADATVATIAPDPATAGTVLVGTSCCGGGMFRTLDGGATFSNITTDLPTTLINAALVVPGTPTTLYAITAMGPYRSTTNGVSWTALGTGLPAGPVPRFFALDPQQAGTFFLAVEANVGANGLLYRLTSTSTTWTLMNSGLPDAAITALAQDPTGPSRLYVGQRGYAVSTTNDRGVSWTPSNTGLLASHISPVAVTPNGTVLVGTPDRGGWRSGNQGNTWAPLTTTGANVSGLAVDVATPNTVYAVAGGVVQKSTDSGITWTNSNTGLPSVGSVAVAPSNSNRVYAARCTNMGDTFFVSNDGGATWAASASAVQQARCSHTIAVHPTNPDRVLLSCGGGWANDAVLLTTDGGATFNPVTVTLGAGIIPGPVVYHPTNGNRAYLGISGGTGGVRASLDSGNIFNVVPGITGDVRSLALDATRNRIFAGMSTQGLMLSEDDGLSWTSVNQGLGNLWLRGMAVSAGTGALYVGTDSSGVYVLE